MANYTIDQHYASDFFTYVITDGHGGMGIGTVTVTRSTGGNHAPLAVSYSSTVQAGQSISLPLIGSDPDGTTLTFTTTSPQFGTLTGSGSSRAYTPNAGFVGLDSFTYQAYDGSPSLSSSLASPPATIRVKVETTANNVPIPGDQSLQATLNTALPITLTAFDQDGDFLMYTCNQPSHGSVTGTAPNITYTPTTSFEGDDWFTFTVTDGKETAVQGTILLTVTRKQIEYLDQPSYTGYTFRGNLTYAVTLNSPITFNGTATIEGGTVIKMPWKSNPADPGAKLKFLGPINLQQVTSYRPVVVTSADDDTVGTMLPNSYHDGSGYYADVAIELPPTGGTILTNMRIAHAHTAIRYPVNSAAASDTLRHVQIVDCEKAFDIQGSASFTRQLTLGNCLVYDVGQVLSGSHCSVQAEHLTVDWCNTLAPDPTSASFSLAVQNSIFHLVGSFGSDGTAFTGNNNGFDSGSPTFGIGPNIADSEFPFAPATSLAAAQGWHYLRDGSPFLGAGSANINSSLAADFRQMTTSVPELLTEDITSSQTIAPTVAREIGTTPSLGYHYPVIDYVLNGATVNNCTLNIDQGTVLGFTAPYYVGSVYEWGLRLNPGGRLNVWGVPTNRVVFARLEAVQENPVNGLSQAGGPLITFKGVFLLSGTMVTPLPEAHFHFADFPTLGGSAAHFGSLLDDHTYDCVSALDLHSCLLQGGIFTYEAGGPQGRVLGLTNTVFEHSVVILKDKANDGHGAYAETLTAANNLFYDCDMWLAPVSTSGGAGWSFIDNIFDNTVFNGNGPATVNDHNAFVSMTGKHVSPSTELNAQDLASLSYQTGPLGRFYLPSSATTLLGGSSRSAASAGLYHFTSLTTNAKQAGGSANIGATYLALDNNGNAVDSNGDGIPDILADRNGNGLEDAGEMPWSSANQGSLTILAPANNSVVSGILKLRVYLVDLGVEAFKPFALFAKVDGALVRHSTCVSSPAESIAEVELDTRHLANGAHTILVTTLFQTDSPSQDGAPGQEFSVSPGITINVMNDLRFPAWENISQVAIKVNIETPSVAQNYTVWFFDASYAKSYDPSPIHGTQGNSSGSISFTDMLTSLGYGDGNRDPTVYSITELPAQNSATVNPNIRNDPTFPDVGRWVVTYDKDPVDGYYQVDNITHEWSLISNILDPLNYFDAGGCTTFNWVGGFHAVFYLEPRIHL